MYNCLQKKSAKLLKKRTPHRLLASLFVFMMILTGAQAATYYWVGRATTPGGDPDNSWTRAENWSTAEGGTEGSGTAYPGAGDDAYIYGTVTITIDSEISIRKLLIKSGTNSLTSDFTTTLSGTGRLTVTDNSDDAINITRCASDNPASITGTLVINLPVTCKGTIQTHSGTTLSVAADKTLSAANLVHSAGNGVPVSKIQVNGTLDLGTGTLNLSGNGNPGANQLVVESGGTVKAGTIEFGQAAYLNTGITKPIINDGTIEVSTSFTIRNFTSGVTLPYDGNGTVKLTAAGATFTNNDDVNISITTLQGTQSSVVSGGGHTSITTATFSAGATVSNTSITTAHFNDTANVSGSTITTADFAGAAVLGTSAANEIGTATFNDAITLDGANTFTTFTATGLSGKTLTVNAEQTFQPGGSVALSGTGTTNLLKVTGNGSGKFTLGSTTLTGEYLSLNTDSSVVSASTGTAFAQKSETTGSGTTSWIVTSAGGHLWNGENGNWETAANWLPQSVPATTDEVIINSGTPKINSAVTVKSITVNGGGINLLSNSLTVETLSLADSTSVTTSDSTTINISDGQKIDEKITGDGKLVLASGKNYTIPASTTIGIDIENNGSLSSTGAVTFSEDFTNSGTGTASFADSVTVSKNFTNSGSATFTGGLSVAGNLEDTGSLTGEITFNGSGDQTFSPNTVIYSSITVNKSAGTLSVDSSLQVTNLTLTSGAVSINGDLTLRNSTAYQNYDFSSLTNTLTFTGGSSASPRVLQAAAITNSSKISADYLKLQAQGSSDIILNSCENISNLTLETSGNISVNGITAASLSIASGAASVKMKDTITLSSTSQDFIIDYPLLLADDTTFTVSKDIIVQDTDGSIKSDTSSGKNLSLTANTIKLLNGNALGDSTTGALGTISINCNLTLGADTQLYSSQINFAGTGAKSLSGAYKLSASGNVSNTGAWTWAAGSTLLFNGSADQTFKTNTNSTYNTIDVVKTTGKFILDTSVLNTDTLTITNCEKIHFKGVNEITTVANLSFPRPVSSDNNLTISNTSGNVSFADTFDSSGNLNIPDVSVTFARDVTAAVISTKATTINCSKIQSSGNQNYAGAVTIGANTELESRSGNISFTSTVDGAHTLKLTSSAGTSFGGNVGASTSLTSLEVNGTSNINCASITTSGDQTYNGTVNLEAGGTTTVTGANVTFNNTINGNNSLTVTSSGDGKVAAFNGNVGATTGKELTSITITGTANINCNSITTTGSQTYNGEVTIDSAKSPMLTAKNGTNNSTVTFKDSVSTTGTGNKLNLSADLITENTASKTVGIELDLTGALTNKGTTTFGKAVKVSSSFTNETGKSATFNENVTVSGAVENNGTVDFKKNLYAYKDVTDNGTWTLSGTDSSLVFRRSAAQIFTPVAATIYKSILIDKSAGSFKTATNALQVGSFADSAANASTITFATSTTIGSDVVFNTSNDVSFTNTTNVFTAGSPNDYHNITHEKGITNLSGTVTAANITLHKANLTGATTLIAHGDVEFKNIGTSSYANIYGSNDLTITVDTGKSVTFNGDVGKADNPIPTALTINGKTNIKCTLIATSGNQVYNGDIAVYSNSTNAYVVLKTDATAEVDFSGDITESETGRKLIINTPLLKSTKTSQANVNVTTVELAQDLSLNSATGGGINLSASSISQTAGSSFTLTNNANLSLTSTSVTISPALENGTSGSLIASSGTTTFNSNVNLSTGDFSATNTGTVVLIGTASGTPQNLTTKSDGTTSFNNLVIKGNVTINNSNTIANLTANGVTDESGLDGAVITFAASSEQTVTGELKLKGKPNVEGEANHRLLLRSSNPSTDTSTGTQWKIKCTGANSHDIEFVDVQDGWNTSETGTPTPVAYNLFAITSNDSGNNTNWNFPGMEYKWKGSSDATDGQKWYIAANWTPSSIPGKGSNVTIPADTDANLIKKLVLEDDVDITYSAADQGIITVNGTFDMADKNLTATEIVNKGLVKLVGKTNQIQGTMSNEDSSTVEYYGSGFESFAWDGDGTAGGKQYQNLIISDEITWGGTNQPDTEALKVSGTTTISAGSGKTVNLNNASNVFTGTVIAGDSTSSTPVNAGAVTLKAYAPITLANNANADSLEIQSAVKLQNVTTSGNQSYTGSVETITGPATLKSTAGNITFDNEVSLEVPTSVTTSAASGTILFGSSATINGTQSLSLSSTDGTTLGANVGNTNALTALTVTGPLNVNCGIIKTSGDQNYKGTVTLNTESNITSTAGNILIEDTGSLNVNADSSFTVSSAEKNIDFSCAITGTSKLTTAGSGTALFNNTINIASLETQTAKINTSTIETTGSQNYKGPVTLAADTNLTSTTDGDITFASTLDGDKLMTLTVPITKAIAVTGKTGSSTTLANPPSITIAQAGTVTFSESLKANAFSITKANATSFANAVDITNFSDDSTNHTGSVSFAEGGSIQTDVTFNTNNTVSFTGTMNIGTDTSRKNLTHSSGSTTINGTLNAADVTLSNTSFTGTMNAANVELSATSSSGTITAATTQIGNLNLAGDTSITTSGTQAYNGTIDDSLAGAHTLELNSGTSQITFTGNVGSTPIKSLTVTGPLTINCESIQTTGPQNYSSPVEISSGTTETITSTGDNIHFADTLTINDDTNISVATDKQIVFDKAITGDTASSLTTNASSIFNAAAIVSGLTSITTNKAEIHCPSITSSGTQTYNGAVTFGADTALTSTNGNITLASTLDGAHTITFSVPDNTTKAITVSGQVGETNRPSVRIAQAGNVNFAQTVKALNFAITKAASTLFARTVQISSFTDSTTAGDITFAEGGTISNPAGTSFITQGGLTLGSTGSAVMSFAPSAPYADLTHTAGNTSITGQLNAANITLAETAGGPMTINNSGLFTTTDSSALTYTTSFSQIGNGNAILGGSFTGSGNASFAKNLQIYGSSQADFGTAGTNINIAGNLIILRDSTDELNLLSNLTVSENLVLYKGPTTASADISTGKDILILGSSYSTADTSTGIADEYAYTTPRHSDWSQPNYTESLLPDGNALPASADYSARLAVAANKKITSAKNFYANGTNLSTAGSDGQWLLSLPDNTNPANGFAEAYHSVVSGCKVICNDGSEDGTKSRLAALECTDSGNESSKQNSNVEFEDFKITKAYTVRDNAVRVEFNQPIRYHVTSINSLRFDNGDSAHNFTGFYSDPDCSQELKSDITLSYLNEADNKTYYYFYIKANSQDNSATGAWNTDANGKSAGSEKSSDRDGIHHASLPCLDFPRALADSSSNASLSFIITDRWGKRLNNYSQRVPLSSSAQAAYGAENSAYEVEDKTGPVLWTVRTGQELHTAYSAAIGEAGQHSYDSHNFLEFRYSEPVAFYEEDAIRSITENFQVTDLLGTINEDISQAQNALTFAGLAKLTAASGSQLKLYTGSQGRPSKYMNSLYRPDQYSIRLSLAGWTEGTVSDYAGNAYKKWPGYIEEASQFTNARASAISENNAAVKDLSGNCQIEYADGNRTEPVVISSSEGNYTPGLLPLSPDLYSAWDLSSPYFAPLRFPTNESTFSSESGWSATNERSEAIGNTNGTGSTLDRIDFHLFDNTPAFNSSDQAEWFTEAGWCLPGSSGSKSNLKDSSYTYAADIVGGARQFDTNSSRRTSGGIRLSTKLAAAPGFLYSSDPDAEPDTAFAASLDHVHSTVVSQLFTGSSEPRHAADDPDGLYLGLGITDIGLPVETTFSFSYDESKAYLTDLAGNRLRSKTSKTIDRTPPSFDIILSPVNQNQIYIVFVKKIVTELERIGAYDEENKKPSEHYSNVKNIISLLPDCFQLVKISENGTFSPAADISIDSTIPARIIERYSDNHFTCISLTTTRNITFEDVSSLHLQLKNHKDWPEKSQDPFTSNKNARVTFIQDYSGNYMPMYSAHALSDFAINYVNPLYAYSSDITEDENPVMDGLYENGSWAVHNWNADQNKYGTLPANHSAALVAEINDGSLSASESTALPNLRLYLSDSPDRASVSSQFNKDFKTSLRVWLPDLTDGVFRALTASNNSRFSYVDSEVLSETSRTTDAAASNLIFNIPLEMIEKWKSGDQISFMFGVTNNDGSPVKIYNNPYFDIENMKYDFSKNIAVPLYSLRMHDTSDIGSLDLWSFRLKGITGQRGGVTILNNVIDAGKGEKTVVKVDMPQDGKLNVIVMTLDGNIISYLHRGIAKSGENYFTWNGKNRNGSLVARGMYFIRVIGDDFDETRKVMVVK